MTENALLARGPHAGRPDAFPAYSPRDRLLELVQQAFQVESRPDSMRVTSAHHPRVLLEIRKSPGGYLSGHMGFAEKPVPLAAHSIILEGSGTVQNWWTIMQPWNRLIDQAILSWEQEEAGEHPDERFDEHPGAVRRLLDVQQGINQNAAREELDAALNALLDPGVLQRAAREKTPVDLTGYNIAAAGPQVLQTLQKQHAGALHWVLEHPSGTGLPWGDQDALSVQDVLDAFRKDMQANRVPEEYLGDGLGDLTGLSTAFMRGICQLDQKAGGNGAAGLILGAFGNICRTWRTEKRGDSAWLEEAAGRLHHMVKRDRHRYWIPRETVVDALISTLEPQVHRTAQAFLSKVGIPQYRLASLGYEEIRQLRRRNPGVIVWAMEHVTPEAPIQHPGEIIRLVKEDMTRNGLDPRAWRTFSQTPEVLTRALARSCNRPQTAALFLNAMARAQARPTPGLVRNLSFAESWLLMQQEAQIPLGLVFRESQRRLLLKPGDRAQHGLAQETQLAWDYCRAMSLRGRKVESRTFAGLMKRSQEWHRQVTWKKLQEEWEQTMVRQHGLYHAWNSILETPVELGGMTALHLGSQQDLFAESREMHHCVHTYVDRCRSGQSRVFSIMRDGQKIATGEIVQVGNDWKTAQVRGVLNGNPPGEAHHTMDLLAAQYSRAWDQGGQHDTWMLTEPASPPR